MLATMVAGHWLSVRDGDPRAFALYRRHYSFKERPTTQRGAPNGRRIIGPSERMILMTVDCSALFAWIYPKVERRDHQRGVNCSIFRNESSVRSSELIEEACGFAWERWPGERLWTYVDPRQVKSANPGYCFLKAGFRRCGRSAKGLHILERWPTEATP